MQLFSLQDLWRLSTENYLFKVTIEALDKGMKYVES